MTHVECKSILLALKVEQRGSLFSILDIWTDFTPPHVPYRLPHVIFVVSIWRGPRASSMPYTIRIIGPSGYAYTQDAVVDFGPTGRAHATEAVKNLYFPAYGEYQLQVLTEDRILASETIAVLPLIEK